MISRCFYSLLFAVALSAASLGFASFAAEISFDGGPEGTGTELTEPTNWDGDVCPGADDVAVISVGSAAKTLTLASDFAIGGLKLTSPSAVLTIGPADAESDPLPRLKLGADGITIATSQSSANGLTLAVPAEVTAAQTWLCGKQVLTTKTPIYGEADLLIMRAYKINHDKAPRYAGKITYKLSTLDWNQKVYYKEAAPWAKVVVCSTDSEIGGNQYWQPYFNITGTWSYSDIFPEGSSYTANLWSVQSYLLAGDVSTVATMDAETLSRMSISGADSTLFGTGKFVLTGGLLQSGAIMTIYSGSTFQQDGGCVSLSSGKGLHVASHSLDGNGKGTYVQNGGACTNYSTYVGGMKPLNWYPYQVTIGKYQLNDGDLTILPNGTGYGGYQALVFSASETKNSRTAPGVFEQNGGTVQANGVTWGIDGAYNNCDGFGLLALNGGTFTLGTRGFNLGTSWNVSDAASYQSNATYRVRLSGGHFVAKPKRIGAQLEVGDESVSTFENAACVTNAGPVFGRGTLVKTGAGELVFADASRFAGALVVSNGTVSVGAYSDPKGTWTYPAPSIAFSADDITGVEDGADVETWTSADGQKSATKANGEGAAAPTFVKGTFGGHNALHFDKASKQALGLANADIPWLGQKSFACAVVFRSRTAGPDGNWDIYGNGNRGAGLVSTAGATDGNRGTMFLAFMSDGCVGGRYNATDNDSEAQRAKYNCCTRKPCGLDDGQVHVAVFSSDETAGKLRIMVDGHHWEQTCPLTSVQNGTFRLRIGSLYQDQATRYFDGDIADVKLFACALDRDQMMALTEEACEKYGTRPLAGRLFADGEAPGSGLNSTNVSVRAGATLALPTVASNEEAPYVVGTGRSVSVSGAVTGTLAVSDGGTILVDAAEPAGTVANLRVSGMVTVAVSGLQEKRSRKVWVPFMTADTYAAASGTTYQIVTTDGVDVGNGVVSVREKDGKSILGVHTQRGFLFLIR